MKKVGGPAFLFINFVNISNISLIILILTYYTSKLRNIAAFDIAWVSKLSNQVALLELLEDCIEETSKCEGNMLTCGAMAKPWMKGKV